jgi:aminoglycoside phosphotransferase (APT) family kinase protein
VELSESARNWLAAATGVVAGELVLRRLAGSTSSSIVLVESRSAPSARCVLRVLDNQRWLEQEPDLAEHEASALRELARAGLRGPELIAYGGREAGFGAPVVLMSFVAGRVELVPDDLDGWLSALAAELVRIHDHTAEGFGWHHRTWLDRRALAPPAWAREPELWRRAIERVRAPPPAARPVFLHRDYHPTNVLWQGHAVRGVVDWINACRGPAGVDIAHCSTNLTSLYGPTAAERFLEAYRAHGGAEHDPYWDLESLLEMTLPEPRFYPPWLEFGLAPIAPERLRERAEAQLERVLRGSGSASRGDT